MKGIPSLITGFFLIGNSFLPAAEPMNRLEQTKDILHQQIAATSEKQVTEQWIQEAQKELFDNILAFWLAHGIDETNGGFVGRAFHDGTALPDAPKGLVLNARLLWTFSAAYRFRDDKPYLDAARRAYTYLDDYFLDKEKGGYYWMLDAKGTPLEDKKELYGNAFVVYALAEYYRAMPSWETLESLKKLFRRLEASCRDTENGGYYESFSRTWQRAEKSTIAYGIDGGIKTMNTHLHLLEAYTNLYRVWRDATVREALEGLVDVFAEHIYDPGQRYCRLFFDAEWNPIQPEMTSYGHDIEAAWLIRDAAIVLQDADRLERANRIARGIGRAVLLRGVDTDGGLFYEGTLTGVTNRAKDWWPQAETVVGYLDLYQLTGDRLYRETALRNWRFIQQNIVDRTHGEWFGRARDKHDPTEQKISEWKGPYHNGRACMEIIRRLSAK
ncbi:MAG: AGE family epimerase/isomerase [Sedimentisphaerales bacterium]|nr:AGE family epimerase/isomerase [Sedimentisphaerales bacterium]